MRAAVVDGAHLVPVREEDERVAAGVDDEPAGGAQLVQIRGSNEAIGR